MRNLEGLLGKNMPHMMELVEIPSMNEFHIISLQG